MTHEALYYFNMKNINKHTNIHTYIHTNKHTYIHTSFFAIPLILLQSVPNLHNTAVRVRVDVVGSFLTGVAKTALPSVCIMIK